MRRHGAPHALRGALAAALAAAACALRLGSVPPTVPPPQPLVFFATADWGGEQEAPYVTPGQLGVASAMGTVSAQAGSHPSFVLAAGDNFYMDGLAGAPRAAGRAARRWAQRRECVVPRARRQLRARRRMLAAPRRAAAAAHAADAAARAPSRARSAAAGRHHCGTRQGHLPGCVHRAGAAGALVLCGGQP
jgi:hypothetical protein